MTREDELVLEIEAAIFNPPKSMHRWVQQGTCLNGPHVWQCSRCHEWTRSRDYPDPNAQLIDPDNGDRYEGRLCQPYPESFDIMKDGTIVPKDERKRP